MSRAPLSKKPAKSAVSDAHVDEAAKLEAALSVSMNMAKSVVAGWMTGGDDKEEEAAKKGLKNAQPTSDDLQRRQQRLGLGAKFLSHTQAQNLEKLALEDKLKKKLLNKKRKRGEGDGLEEEEEEEEEEKVGSMRDGKNTKKPKKDQDQKGKKEAEDDEDAGESRTKAIKASSVPASTQIDLSSLKKNKKKKSKTAGAGPTSAPATTTTTLGKAGKEEGEEEDSGETIASSVQKPAASAGAATEVKEGEEETLPTGASDPAAPSVPFKRKKKGTRSRQKNIKKDTRPAEKKPTYLNPEAANYVGDKRFNQRKNFAKAQGKGKPSDPVEASS